MDFYSLLPPSSSFDRRDQSAAEAYMVAVCQDAHVWPWLASLVPYPCLFHVPLPATSAPDWTWQLALGYIVGLRERRNINLARRVLVPQVIPPELRPWLRPRTAHIPTKSGSQHRSANARRQPMPPGRCVSERGPPAHSRDEIYVAPARVRSTSYMPQHCEPTAAWKMSSI